MSVHKPAFGFGTFVKLLSLNAKPQFSIAKTRLRPTGSGRDFHDSLRHRLRRLLIDGEAEASVFSSLTLIKQKPERLSAEAGLERIIHWRIKYSGAISRGTPITVESPSGYYTVRYMPDFCLSTDRLDLPVVVYNNKAPRPDRRFTYAALLLIAEAYHRAGAGIPDLALLDLPTLTLLRLSEGRGVRPVAEKLLPALDRVFERALSERGPPPAPGPTPYLS